MSPAVLSNCLFSIPPILDALCSYLEVLYIVRFSWTCHGAHDAVGRYMKRAYNFDRHFSHFFNDTRGFRQLLHDSDAVVSGSNALQFLTCQSWPDADLDLYATIEGAKEVLRWLRKEGYAFEPREGQPTNALDALASDSDPWAYEELRNDRISHVLDFVRSAPEERKVQVITPHSHVSLLEVILGFHSTCVMNLITHDAAYCLYPSLTLSGKSLHFRKASLFPIKKYRQRGWDMIPFRWSYEPWWKLGCVVSKRSMGDRHCWTIPVGPALTRDWDPLAVLEWTMGDVAGNGFTPLASSLE